MIVHIIPGVFLFAGRMYLITGISTSPPIPLAKTSDKIKSFLFPHISRNSEILSTTRNIKLHAHSII